LSLPISPSLAGHVAWLVALGRPQALRLLLSPRLGIAASGIVGEASLFLGLEIPVSEKISLRPELAGRFYASWDGSFRTFLLHAGMAVVF
jgi:hypothetical protein